MYLSKKTIDLIKENSSSLYDNDNDAGGRRIKDSFLRQESPMGNTLLHVAAEYGNENLVENIISIRRELVHAENKKGDTPLHVAARGGHVSILRKLLVQCLSFFPYSQYPVEALDLILVRNKLGNTFFHEALLNGCKDVTGMLRSQETPFEDGFKEFIERAALFCINNEDKSVLYLAIERGYKEFVLDALFPSTSKITVLRYISYYPFQFLTWLTEKDETKDMSDILAKILRTKREWIRLKGAEGKIPIHFAASIGYVHGVEELLKTCSSCNMERDKDGLSPLHLACAGGHTKVVKKLLEHEDSPDPREILDNCGRNIAHIAAVMGKFNVIRYILQDGKHGLVEMINDKDYEGNTPLHLATLLWHPKVVHALTWDKRVVLTSVNDKKETALDASLKYSFQNPTLRQQLVWTALKSAGVAEKGSHSIEIHAQNDPKGIDMSPYKDRINTLILVSTLITTVTFAAGFTLPGGTNSSDPGKGMALMLNHALFKIFIFCNTISIYDSISVTITLLWAQLGDITLALSALKVARPLLGVTLATLSVAFLAGVHLVISDLSWFATTSLVLSVVLILMLLFLYVLLWFPSTSKNIVLRRISYYPFRFQTWLVEEDESKGM
ncbi:hypothetical protein Fmac_018555 [Flemingia macrophylla]|uniref:PGG domain-containing protein n=1 Tax=Flemingia macrophylla TaxID=520843 RepID=A0ABD1M5B2_9FABA